MTREEQELLLKDLCARLPYGVKMWFPSVIAPIVLDEFVLSVARRRDEEFKPYLRPMESMTADEEREFLSLGSGLAYKYKQVIYNTDQIDWLLKNHFDYRGLIPMGLALPAKEDMYKEK